MTTHVVYEGDSVYSKLEKNPDIQIGDRIVYSGNNQMGNATYEVICKEKGLKLISDYDSEMNTVEYSDDDKSVKRSRSRSRSRSRRTGNRGGKRNRRKTQRKYKKM